MNLVNVMHANNAVDKQCLYPIILVDTKGHDREEKKDLLLSFFSVAMFLSLDSSPLLRGVYIQEIIHGITDSAAPVLVV